MRDLSCVKVRVVKAGENLCDFEFDDYFTVDDSTGKVVRAEDVFESASPAEPVVDHTVIETASPRFYRLNAAQTAPKTLIRITACDDDGPLYHEFEAVGLDWFMQHNYEDLDGTAQSMLSLENRKDSVAEAKSLTFFATWSFVYSEDDSEVELIGSIEI